MDAVPRLTTLLAIHTTKNCATIRFPKARLQLVKKLEDDDEDDDDDDEAGAEEVSFPLSPPFPAASGD